MRKTRRALRGGKYMGEGSYGCTFTDSPLKCTTNASRRNKHQLSKLMDPVVLDPYTGDKSYPWLEEYSKSNLLRAIDPTEQYFITVNHTCDWDPSNRMKSNQLDKCTVIKSQPAPKKLLFSSFGGTEFAKLYPLMPEQYAPVFKSFINLFDGLQLAHDNRIIHHDIKSQNIVTGPVLDGVSLLTRYIDFGFVHTFPITDPAEKAALNQQIVDTYVYWPFDIRYTNVHVNLNARKSENIHIFEKEYTAWHREYKTYYSDFLPVFFDISGNPRSNYMDYYTIVIKPHYSLYNTKQEDILMAADRYALGIVMIDLLRMLYYSIQYTTPTTIEFCIRTNGKLPEKMVYARALEMYGLPASIADWHRDVCENIAKPIKDCIYGLCKYDPLKRMTIAEAKKLYSTILPHIDRLFEPSLVYEGVRAVRSIPGFQLKAPSPAPPAPPKNTSTSGVDLPSNITGIPPLPKSRHSSRRNRRRKNSRRSSRYGHTMPTHTFLRGLSTLVANATIPFMNGSFNASEQNESLISAFNATSAIPDISATADSYGDTGFMNSIPVGVEVLLSVGMLYCYIHCYIGTPRQIWREWVQHKKNKAAEAAASDSEKVRPLLWLAYWMMFHLLALMDPAAPFKALIRPKFSPQFRHSN